MRRTARTRFAKINSSEMRSDWTHELEVVVVHIHPALDRSTTEIVSVVVLTTIIKISDKERG